MIEYCPFCGHSLLRPLKDGIATCTHCSRVFDSCPFNRLLSAGWLMRKKGYDSVEELERAGIDPDEAILVNGFVGENGFSHEEFFKVLRKLGVSEKYAPVP
jgi:hypothetical protein